jgi:hypothetical protein
MMVVIAAMMILLHPLHSPFALISPKIHMQYMLLRQIHFMFLVSQERLKAFPSHSCKMNQWITVVSMMSAFNSLNAQKFSVINYFSPLEFILFYFSILLQLVLVFMFPFCHLVTRGEELTT